MGQLVGRGPLAAVVDAVSWQDYLGGIIQHHCSSQWSNHAVLVVGYDTTGTCCHDSGIRRKRSSGKTAGIWDFTPANIYLFWVKEYVKASGPEEVI